MIRGTTPTFTLKIKDENIDLSLANNVVFTIEQGVKSVTKSGDDIEIEDGRTVLVFLDQEESLSFKPGASAKIQLNWTYSDASGRLRRAATHTKEIEISEQLLREVIE